jgi:hypothetical protein
LISLALLATSASLGVALPFANCPATPWLISLNPCVFTPHGPRGGIFLAAIS